MKVDIKLRRKIWACYLLLIIALFFAAVGCAHVYTPPERITIDVPIEIYLYDSVADLQTACEVGQWKIDSCEILLGIYRSNGSEQHDLHCVKWDFEVCGHELYHVLQREGSPVLDPDNREHFGATK